MIHSMMGSREALEHVRIALSSSSNEKDIAATRTIQEVLEQEGCDDTYDGKLTSLMDKVMFG